jgi:hypothetical protein
MLSHWLIEHHTTHLIIVHVWTVKETSHGLFAAARIHQPIAFGFWKGKRGFTLSLVKKART